MLMIFSTLLLIRHLWQPKTVVFMHLNTNMQSYLEAFVGQSSKLYLNVIHFSTRVLIRHLWELKTVVFLHWYLICALLLNQVKIYFPINVYRLVNACGISSLSQYNKSFWLYKLCNLVS